MTPRGTPPTGGIPRTRRTRRAGLGIPATQGIPRTRGIPAPLSWTRPELLLAGLLLVLAAVAWLLSGRLGMPDMRYGVLTGMAPMAPSMTPEMAGAPIAAGLFLLAWVVMMVAMMLPVITPFTVGLRRMMRVRPHPQGALTALTIGYLLVWSVTGVLALVVVRLFNSVAMTSEAAGMRIGAGVLLVAGAYQFTPLKQWCLMRCRSPFALVVRHGDRATASRRGALLVGVDHGGYCLGCCWGLMLVLLAAGAMNLVWMAVIAAVIAVEKILPYGRTLGHVFGGLFVALGAVLAVASFG